MAATVLPAMAEPQVEQMFESLPDITLRPDSAARGSRVTGTHVATKSVNLTSTAKKSEFPLNPQQALQNYKRVLTNYEQEEILGYNQVYFVGSSARKINAAEGKGNNFGYDDDKNRYKCVKNDHIAYRYEILKGLGKGSFGDVVKTYDHKKKKHLAVKIIRNERRFHKQGQIEVRILDHLRKQDKKKNHNVIHMTDFFTFRNHLCITFDLLNMDLYSALKQGGFKGFDLSKIHTYATQLLSCLRLLRRNRIIHCDLKPENILINEKGQDNLTVIDFGSACYDNQKIHTYIQSRFYRSPEVILGQGYGTGIDMWSLACILCELHTGQPLFPGRDEKEQLMMQMELLGTPPTHIREAGKRSHLFFSSDGEPRYLVDRKGRNRTPGSKRLSEMVKSQEPLFLNFLQCCLQWDPSKRMTPREASKHPWITGMNLRGSAGVELSRSRSDGFATMVSKSSKGSRSLKAPAAKKLRSFKPSATAPGPVGLDANRAQTQAEKQPNPAKE